MRLRNIPGAREAMIASPYVIQEPQLLRGQWSKTCFHNANPIHIEIGMGKGQFITQLAIQNPHINYIGIEKYSSVLLRALEKHPEELTNLFFIRTDAETICDIFAPEEIDRIYLNFSDPWPKDRHAKRRLTSAEFLRRYEQILIPGHLIEFKTDNMDLFDFSLESVKEAGWTLDIYTKDLHNSPYCEGNIMTEYEQKFSSMGNPICKLIAHKEA